MTLHTDSHFTPTARPSCPECGAAMWLRYIEPEKACYDRRTYACPSCDAVQSVIVKFDQ